MAKKPSESRPQSATRTAAEAIAIENQLSRLPEPEYERIKQFRAFHRLCTVLSHMSLWGLPEYQQPDETDRIAFSKVIEAGKLMRYVEDCKRDALANGCDVPDEVLAEFSAISLTRDGMLPDTDRVRLFTLAKRLHYTRVLKVFAAPATRTGKPLPDSQQEVLDIIREQGPLRGKEICKITVGEESTLRRHIIPALKKSHGIKNRPGAGYYLP